MVLGIKKIPKGVVGILDDGTVVVDEGAGKEPKEGEVKVLRVGKIRML